MPVKPVDETNGFELKLGKNYYQFVENETPLNNSSSARIAVDKYCSNKLLAMAGIPVPKAIFLTIKEFEQGTFEDKIARLTFPLVIKPVDGSLGIGVLCNIQTLNELKIFLTDYFTLYPELIIEEFHGNLKSYRVLVLNRQVIGVVLRHSASVIGDGKHNLEELIALANSNRKKINEYLGPIRIDDECKIRLKELNIDVNYIPALNEKIILNYTSNATRGGTFESLDNQICPKNRKLMVQVAAILNLNLVGIDVECTDINKPITESQGVIIEVNHRPSIRMHELPMSGNPNFVSKKIMRSFILRHPLSYLYALYSNKPTAFYIRALIILSLLGVFYWRS